MRKTCPETLVSQVFVLPCCIEYTPCHNIHPSSRDLSGCTSMAACDWLSALVRVKQSVSCGWSVMLVLEHSVEGWVGSGVVMDIVPLAMKSIPSKIFCSIGTESSK